MGFVADTLGGLLEKFAKNKARTVQVTIEGGVLKTSIYDWLLRVGRRKLTRCSNEYVT